jgi:hypothetical protein
LACVSPSPLRLGLDAHARVELFVDLPFQKGPGRSPGCACRQVTDSPRRSRLSEPDGTCTRVALEARARIPWSGVSPLRSPRQLWTPDQLPGQGVMVQSHFFRVAPRSGAAAWDRIEGLALMGRGDYSSKPPSNWRGASRRKSSSTGRGTAGVVSPRPGRLRVRQACGGLCRSVSSNGWGELVSPGNHLRGHYSIL